MSEPLPRVLLVEDDPVSAAFLCGALSALPLRVDAAASAGQALAASALLRPALLLLDLQLPDGDGLALLQSLRAQGVGCPAIALTADAQARMAGPLAAAGFAAIAHKPLSADALRRLVADWLPLPVQAPSVAEPAPPRMQCGAELPDWDPQAALAAAGGRREIVEQLHGLLRRDLPEQCAALQALLANGDGAGAQALLHRLHGAAAFCGAARMAASAQALDAALRRGEPYGVALDELLEASEAVLGRGAVSA